MYEVRVFNPYRISTLINNMTKKRNLHLGSKKNDFLYDKKKEANIYALE